MNDQMLSEKKFEFVWDNTFHKTQVSFKTPVLNKEKCSVSGDWGPMYTFELSAKSPIEISYKDLKSNEQEKFVLDNKQLILESPMLADERKELPLYYIIEHKEQSIRYLLYVNEGFDLHKVKVIRMEDKVCLYELVL